jgi:hypothetical protein
MCSPHGELDAGQAQPDDGVRGAADLQGRRGRRPAQRASPRAAASPSPTTSSASASSSSPIIARELLTHRPNVHRPSSLAPRTSDNPTSHVSDMAVVHTSRAPRAHRLRPGPTPLTSVVAAPHPAVVVAPRQSHGSVSGARRRFGPAASVTRRSAAQLGASAKALSVDADQLDCDRQQSSARGEPWLGWVDGAAVSTGSSDRKVSKAPRP